MNSEDRCDTGGCGNGRSEARAARVQYRKIRNQCIMLIAVHPLDGRSCHKVSARKKLSGLQSHPPPAPGPRPQAPGPRPQTLMKGHE